jgi:hypothetical protein
MRLILRRGKINCDLILCNSLLSKDLRREIALKRGGEKSEEVRVDKKVGEKVTWPS